MTDRRTIAVIGGGAAGLGAAWLLSRRYDTTLYEAADRLGGHAHTVDIAAFGRPVAVDTGFIVYNELNYPQLTRLFAALGVATQPSSMSFSVSVDDGAFEYAGNARGMLAQPTNLLRPAFWRMLRDIRRFNREARDLAAGGGGGRMSLADFIRRQRYSTQFAQNYLLPMGAAIWSASLENIGAYPADRFAVFFHNHGLLRLRGRLAWRTVTGGSRGYVERLRQTMPARVCVGRPVRAVRRRPTEVHVLDDDGNTETYDQVVFATHADETLRLLGSQATTEERRILGAFRYARNRALLHGDARLMPKRKRAWASWNYLASGGRNGSAAVCVTYWMNRLQDLTTPRPLLMTLNPAREPDPALVFGEFEYDHPQLDQRAVAAQRHLPDLQGRSRSWFCGAYCGHGFHEDALRSGFEVAAALGAPTPWSLAPTPANWPTARPLFAPAEAAE